MSDRPDNVTEPTAEQSGRAMFRWSLTAAMVLLLAMAGPLLSGLVPTRDDLGAFHLPIRAFYAGQLARGEPFDWMPQLYCGFYLTGEGQAGTYHPLHWVLYRFLPLETAWALELWASYPFLLAGTYLFLRRRLGRRDAAMFGSLVFTFSGFMLLHFVHPNAVAVSAHIPWLLWAIDVALGDDRPSRVAAAVAGVALLTGSELLLGYPQYVWFSLLAEGACVLFLVVGRRAHEHGSTGHGEPCLGRLAQLAVAKAAGLMLGGVQLLPTVEALGQSVRRSADAAFVNSGSLYPLNLVQLVAPYLFAHRVIGQNTHELGLYVGAVPLVLAIWAVARWFRPFVVTRFIGSVERKVAPDRTNAVTANDRMNAVTTNLPAVLVGGVVALLLAFGKYGPIYRWQRMVPLAGGFRFPCRYTLLFSLSAAVIAAIGFATLARRPAGRRGLHWSETVAVLLPAACAAVAAAVGLALVDRPFIAAPAAVLAGPALAGLASLLVFLAARGVRGALIALVLFAAADLGCYGLSYAVYPGAMRLEQFVRGAVTPPHGPNGRVVADTRTGDAMLLAGFQRADGYAGLEPARRLDYRQPAAQEAAGVRWVKRTEAGAAHEGLLAGQGEWLEVPRPLARVRLMCRARQSDNPARQLAEISLVSTALVEQPLALTPGGPGTAAVVEERPGWVQVRVDAATPQLLVVSESYHAGWKARVDGRPCRVWRTNGDFLGCPVLPGEHDVCFEFAPESLRRGWIVSFLGLALMLVSAAGCFWRPRFGLVED